MVMNTEQLKATKQPESTTAEFARQVHDIEADLRKLEVKLEHATEAKKALTAQRDDLLADLRNFIHDATPSLFQK